MSVIRPSVRGIVLLATAALLSQLAVQLVAQTPLRDASVVKTQPSRAQIDAWIEALRDDAYAVRQAAARQLLAAGAAALKPLAEATDSPDPEARAAARRLVTLIDKAETNRRLAEFAADVDGKQGLSLPGWEQYRKLVGGDASARALFVEMQRQEAALLADVFDASRHTNKQNWEDRLLRLLRWPAMPADQPASSSIGTCATMLFLGSVAEAEPSDRAASYLYQLLQRPPVQPILVRAGRNDPLRRLVVGWVVDCPNRSASVIQQRLTLALALDMQEAVSLAVDVAQNNPAYLTVPPMVRAQALVLVAHLGGQSEVDRLEPLLEDATVCMPQGAVAQQFQPGQPPQPVQVGRDVQIRDLALVAMLLLTDQEPADYGYRHARRQSQQLLDAGSVFAESDVSRAAAIAKWRESKAQQSRDAAAQKQVN